MSKLRYMETVYNYNYKHAWIKFIIKVIKDIRAVRPRNRLHSNVDFEAVRILSLLALSYTYMKEIKMFQYNLTEGVNVDSKSIIHFYSF